MKTPLVVSGLALSAAMVSSAHAAFTGFTVESAGTVSVGGQSRQVFKVYANFNASTDILLNVLKHSVTAGTMNALHNDFDSQDGGTGSWNPSLTGNSAAANDSYVTIRGVHGSGAGTNLDPGFGEGFGGSIPSGAGWFNSNPANNVVVGSGLRIMVMQVVIAAGGAGYTASAEVGYKANASDTTPLFGAGTYTIPAPGALVLLGAAGLVGRRRRA
jgi:hypothetical protein